MAPLAAYFDPFIGVDGGGNTLPGPCVPLGLVRLGPDTVSLAPQQTNGYRSDQPIRHFSHTHVSGTGGGSRYGNVGMAPYAGAPRDTLCGFGKADETAAAGYYAVTLLPDRVRAELTASARVGVHRYTFPAGAQANVFIDAAAVLRMGNMVPGDRREDGTGACIGGFIELVSDREVIGRGDFRGGWGHIYPYSVYFYARFDAPFKGKVGNHYGVMPVPVADEQGCFATLAIGARERVEAQVGVSYVSVAKARSSVERETAGKSFDEVRAEAERAWERLFARIRVEGGNEPICTLFYTQFARLMCMPTDLGVDDEFGLWHSGVRHFTDFYTLWDSVRNTNSLLTLFAPELERDYLNCLLDIAGHTGWLPDVWIQGHSGMVQGGSSPDVLFCEAHGKGIGGIDYARALHFMLKNGTEAPDNPYYRGRFLEDYLDLGYASTRVRKNCVSRHLEYAYQDWCAGRLAARLGELETAAERYASAAKLWNLWRNDLKCFAPRSPGGEWAEPFDPESCLPDAWNDPYFYEGTARQWSFNTQHDFAGLVARHGGPEGFVAHLDDFFGGGAGLTAHERQPMPAFDRRLGRYHSKETMLHVPWLYTYAGRPDLAAARVRQCLGLFFRPTRDGLSDNEDMGCQSAFYMAGALGLYPIMGQDLYLLSAPLFDAAHITLGEDGPVFTIQCIGPEDGTYVAAARLDGKPLERAWLRHGEIAHGAALEIERAESPTGWGRDAPPPSPGSVELGG